MVRLNKICRRIKYFHVHRYYNTVKVFIKKIQRAFTKVSPSKLKAATSAAKSICVQKPTAKTYMQETQLKKSLKKFSMTEDYINERC